MEEDQVIGKEEQTEEEDRSRNGEWARGLFKKLESLESQIANEKAEKERVAKEAEEKRLLEANDFETLKSRLKAEADAKVSEMRETVKRAKIDAMTAGIQDEFRREGVTAKLLSFDDEAQISEYFDGLKKEHSYLWETTSFPKSQSTPSGARTNNMSFGKSRKELFDLRDNGTPEQKKAALQHLKEHFAKHGKLPE